MKTSILGIVAFCLLGCAATYTPPTTIPKMAEEKISATKDQIYSAGLKAILEEGYTITASDKEAGIISTAKTQKRLTEADCDCGKTMGIDYVKDNRTTTEVSFNLSAGEGEAKVKATITGNYLPNDPVYGKTFECVSKGTLEAGLVAALRKNIQ